AREANDGAGQPIGDGEAEQGRDADGQERGADEGGPGELEEGLDVDRRLDDGEHSVQAPVAVDRRADVQRGRELVGRIVQAGTDAVATLQGELDVVELAVVLAHRPGPSRVEHDLPGSVGDVELEVHGRFLEVVDPGGQLPRMGPGQRGFEI